MINELWNMDGQTKGKDGDYGEGRVQDQEFSLDLIFGPQHCLFVVWFKSNGIVSYNTYNT